MENLYSRFASDLPLSARQAHVKASDKLVVLLTGATGSLGSSTSWMRCLADPCVSRSLLPQPGPREPPASAGVHGCKGPAISQRQGRGGRSRHFGTLPGAPRREVQRALVRGYNCYPQRLARLTSTCLSSLCRECRVCPPIYRSFCTFRFAAQVFFVSSISSVGNWAAAAGEGSRGVSEQIVDNWQVPQPMGYGRSKFVAERLLDAAAQEAGFLRSSAASGKWPAQPLRREAWPKQEWLPSLIASSKFLRKIPVTLGQMETVDWIPVDILGRGIVELADHRARSSATTWRCGLPRRQPAADGLVCHRGNRCRNPR